VSLHLNKEGDAEKAALLRALNWQRTHVLAAIDGLSDALLRTAALPSGWTFVGLVQHLTLGVERYWFGSIVAGDPFDMHAGDEADEWQVNKATSPHAIVDRYRTQIDDSNRILESAVLSGVPIQVDPDWPDWFSGFREVRSVVLHVITETACHAGHLDAARELVDGQRWPGLSPND
jgi:Protein of unknown function (DUF664)